MQKVDLNDKSVLVIDFMVLIGANLVLWLQRGMNGSTVVGLDNMDDYYAPALKEYRPNLIGQEAKKSLAKHVFMKDSIADKVLVDGSV